MKSRPKRRYGRFCINIGAFSDSKAESIPMRVGLLDYRGVKPYIGFILMKHTS